MGKKTRVYELARELGKNSKEILDLLAESGVRDKNHMSALEDNVVRFIKNRFAEKEGRKEPENAAAGRAQPAAEEEKPTPKEQQPAREKPKPKPKPVPLPRPTASRGGVSAHGPARPRPTAGDARGGHPGALPVSAQRPGWAPRPAGETRPGAAHGRPHDREDRRWTPAGAPSVAQKPGPARHWPTQIAPTVPGAGVRPQAQPTRPGLGAGASTVRPATAPGAAHGRPDVLRRPRQIRPSVPPPPPERRAPETAAGTASASPSVVAGADAAVHRKQPEKPTPQVAQVATTPAPQAPAPAGAVPETPEVAAKAPEKAPEVVRVTGSEGETTAKAAASASASAPAPTGASAAPAEKVHQEALSAAGLTPPEEERAGAAGAVEHVRGAEKPQPSAAAESPSSQRGPRQPAVKRPESVRPSAGVEAGAEARPRPAHGGHQGPAAPEAKKPSAAPVERREKPETRREHKDERKDRRERPTERRLELIKTGKGAEKLREARAEAIIRARMPKRGATVQPATAAKRREHPKKQTKIALPPRITVGELAEKLGIGSAEVIKSLMTMGVLATINQEIDFDAASLVADEHGFDVEPLEQKEAREFGIEDVPDAPEALQPRPPVVTVLGHVDHGKTSLLDAIRQTNVTAQEAGGITQHIGAYQVELGGRKITFIDTPGHEAFTAMRARGAQVTDIAVLVVAADDGVMPQTVEAINHARAAKVPIVVAINKIDKANAQPDRVKQELAQQGLVPEEWGGDTVTVEISALRKQGIEELLEMILLVADMRELKANPNRPAKGTVIEARLDRGRGPVATVLVEKGTLRVGDPIVAGEVFGKVRAMTDDQGKPVEAAGPSMPVEVLGFSEVPQAGDVLHVVSEDKLAKQLAARRLERKRAEEIQGARPVSLEALFGKIKEGEVKELNLIIKADVQGSVEALRQSLEHLSTDEVKVNVIHAGVGAITESDVMLASASGAIIIGFQVRPDANAKKMAERDGVDIRLYRIIYDATADVKAAMEGLLEPERREVTVGRAEVMATFHVPKVGVVAGCKVSEGKITRDALARVLRDNVVIHEGRIESLKRFKDDVPEVATGYECGIGLANFHDIKEGDVIEAFTVEETRREL